MQTSNLKRTVEPMLKFVEDAAISFESAHETIAVAIKIAAEQGVNAVVTVADPKLQLVAFGKSDGATPHSVETSRRKALTSASTRKPTGWMDSSFAIEAPLATGTILTNILGGVALAVDGRHLGGLGIAGGTPAQDAEIARLVLEKIAPGS